MYHRHNDIVWRSFVQGEKGEETVQAEAAQETDAQHCHDVPWRYFLRVFYLRAGWWCAKLRLKSQRVSHPFPQKRKFMGQFMDLSPRNKKMLSLSGHVLLLGNFIWQKTSLSPFF
ncbi:hypothetical protein [Ktedonobacter robiniae]|uniref:hypothetical protein n=1 Tax=Ktedonobacter robiniae TaxID=2778365 RepID=UPI0019150201|nr:hypothetical protein [Ktedonobacter robiniae]